MRAHNLARKPDPLVAMYTQARAFAESSQQAYQNGLTRTPTNILSVAPFVVNSAFSIELYLKGLHRSYGKTEKTGHSLHKLYRELPGKCRKGIEVLFSKVCEARNCDKEKRLEVILKEHDLAFVEWRYLHEKEKTGRIQVEYMVASVIALDDYLGAMIKGKKGAT